ncbi:MAG: FdtA/QdtA family cupin domain-containing protein [Cycloclasticus sp.]|jgi:WxcM-like, C-terminal.
MSLVKIVELPNRGDDRGGLAVIEGGKTIPFDIKRTYYIYDTKQGVSRGFHAHRDLKQIAFCVSGSCEILLDDGKSKESVLLDDPLKALRIDEMVWHEMHDFSEDCVLLVLASDFYDECDYIRNYEEFISLVSR